MTAWDERAQEEFYAGVAALLARAKGRKERGLTARIWRAMMLAPSAEICDALLRGEAVPISKLDPEWARRFGLRDD